MNSKYNVFIENNSLVFPGETIPLDRIDHVIVDHRAFTCTTVLLCFIVGSGLCLYYMPEMIFLVVGCVFVWLKIEYSRYIELKVKFRDGSVKCMLSCSFGDREKLYALYDSLKKQIPDFDSKA